MHRQASMNMVLGVGMLTILMLTLTTCGGSSAQEEQANKEKASKEQASNVRTIPEDSQTYEGEPLPSGDYVSEEFKPAMSFGLVKGWTRGGAELRDVLDMRDIENDTLWLVFMNAEQVYDPKGPDGLKIAPAPEDMLAWLQANPHMKPEKPKPTSVGGEKGVQFDAIVTGAVESPECIGCVDLPLFHLSNGETSGVEKGDKVRFIVLEDVKGQTVTIFVEAPASGFGGFVPKAQQVIDSVEWGDS